MPVKSEHLKRETRAGQVTDDRAREAATSRAEVAHWTVQQFTTLPGGPWYALHKQTDEGVIWGFTGYRHEIDALCRKLRIDPEELPPIAEEEYHRRMAGDLPDPQP